MTNRPRPLGPLVRRLLVIDDQQEIHDTFARIFSPAGDDDAALEAFESRFLSVDADHPASARRTTTGQPRYELAFAHSGEQAIDLVRESARNGVPYSVAFVDMRMPLGWDGLETTERLWKIDPSLQVVICTAHSDHQWGDVLRRLGYTDRLLLIKKPFESDEVRQLALALSEKNYLEAIRHRKLTELQQEVELRQRVEEELREMALRDSLTSLPNRCYLLQRLHTLVRAREESPNRQDALLFLDLDNFKLINDSMGHDAGDELLNQVASRLQECVRQQDFAGRCGAGDETTVRLGGDEFVVLLERLNDPQDALAVARRIVERLGEPFELGDRIVNIGTSVGVAFIDGYVRDGNEALRNADTAMYRAKQAGKGRIAIFDQTMHQDVCDRLEIEEQLRLAAERRDFTLRYQPIVDLRQHRIAGAEVLIRWQRDDGTSVAPDDFIPIIEEIGLIHQVGEWVIERAMEEVGSLHARLPGVDLNDFYIGINVSKRQLGDPNFPQRIEAILGRTGFDRRRLKLEMNETADPRHGDQILRTLQNLEASGIGIHIDDFGKGQSSLTCFQAYPIETVKIDRAFTASIAVDHGHSVITQAMIQLAHHLRARIVAEGVEDPHQLRILRDWGCDLAQGYLFSPPLTLDELGDLIRDPSTNAGLRQLRDPQRPPSASPPPPKSDRDSFSPKSLSLPLAGASNRPSTAEGPCPPR